MRMRSPLPYLFVLVLSQALLGCVATPTPTNQLANLIATGKVGQHRLEPAWVGECQTTYMTGYLAGDTWNSTLLFDVFAHFDKPTVLGSRVIGRSIDQTDQGFAISHVYRESFPSDAELKAAHTISELKKLLGPSPGFVDSWGGPQTLHSHAGWSYFRLNDNATLETLAVKCLTLQTNGQSEWYVESIRIRRGIARPKRRRPNPGRSRTRASSVAAMSLGF